MGGLPKRQTLLKQHNLDKSKSLLVDAGSLLFERTSYPTGRAIEQVKITASGLVKAHNIMGYDAVGISAKDLAAGLDFLREEANKSDFSWLSANLVDFASGKPLFPPFVIKERADLKIAVIGLTGSDANVHLQKNGSAKVLPWQDVLPALVDKLSPQSDLIILLSSENEKENEKISQQFGTINILIETAMRPHNATGKIINNTLIAQTDKQGKYLGKLRVNWDRAGIWKEKKKPSKILERQELDRIDWQLKRLRSKGDPEKIYQDRPANLRAYRKLVTRQKELETILAAPPSNSVDTAKGKSTFQNKFLELDPKIVDDPTIGQLVMQIKRDVNALGKKRTTKTILPGFTGSKTCVSCHEEVAAKWDQTPHARAYQTLVEKGQQYNTNCLPCHVTGISMENKDKSLSIPKELFNVGCESCHGPSEKHSKKPGEAKMASTPASSLCLQCHSDEHDDDFNYERDMKLVH